MGKVESDKLRDKLLEEIRLRTTNPLIVHAFEAVDRRNFIPTNSGRLAFRDKVITLTDSSTVSQPTLVAEMMDSLQFRGGGKALEIGTASAFGAALLGQCAEEVHTIEHDHKLADKAAKRLRHLGIENVHVHEGDGALGWPENSPYDYIIVTAAVRLLPLALTNQLRVGGTIVAPTGNDPVHLSLSVGYRHPHGVLVGEATDYQGERFGIRFVPLMSDQEGGFNREFLKKVVDTKALIIAKALGGPKEDLTVATKRFKEVYKIDLKTPLESILELIKFPNFLYGLEGLELDEYVTHLAETIRRQFPQEAPANH